jgi:hypothetical protein
MLAPKRIKTHKDFQTVPPLFSFHHHTLSPALPLLLPLRNSTRTQGQNQYIPYLLLNQLLEFFYSALLFLTRIIPNITMLSKSLVALSIVSATLAQKAGTFADGGNTQVSAMMVSVRSAA